jgi:TolB-like protein/tetratricopeptide (TPR) repeat protein
MASIIEGYSYDIFISYRQKDNKYDGWVTEFVDNLNKELEATFKEEISVYFDINPHDGLLETHDVDASLKEKLKCLVFIPITSRTYCDPKSFAWEHEFKAFVEQASKDQFGLKVKLPNGNVASRVLPIRIYDLDSADIKLCESVLVGALRGVEFIYTEPGVNRPLKSDDDEKINLNKTKYRNQINKVANAIKEIISGLKKEPGEYVAAQKEVLSTKDEPIIQEKSIIVLPFKNISPDPDQEYFSDGLTEEIITDLSYIKDLLVISRSSAMTFKGTKNTVKEIAEKVNVQYVLEGSVRKAGNNIRITAQLIDGMTDSHLWAKKYSGTLDDVFNIQEKVSRSIVDALTMELSPTEYENLVKRPIKNMQAYECYIKARQDIYTFTKDGLDRAVSYLQHGLEIIGKNAFLYAGLGFTYSQYVNIGIGHEEYVDKAENYAKMALELESDSSDAHFVLGFLNLIFHGNPKKSIQHFKKALEIFPDDTNVLFWLTAGYGTNWGKPKEARESYNRLLKLDPFNHWAYSSYILDVMAEYHLDLSVDYLTKWVRIMPKYPVALFFSAQFLAYCNHFKEASALVNKNARPDMKDVFTKLCLFVKYAIDSDEKRIHELLTVDFVKTTRRDCQSSYFVSSLFALTGMKDEAFDWLENAVDRGFINYPFINEYDPLLVSIRSKPRFKKLMERVKYEWENFEV